LTKSASLNARSSRSTGVDRSSPVPLWAQILSDLRSRLAAGEFQERFPTDEALSAGYGVSRQTVREAVRRLQEEGHLVRERGRGTTLARVELEQPLRSLYSVARSVASQGHRERSEVLRFEIVRGGGAFAEALELSGEQEAVHIRRLRFVDDEPLSLEDSWLPADRALALERADLSSGSLYDALRVMCGIVVSGGWERIRPANPTEAQRRLLRLPMREAVFRVDRFVHDGTGPVERRVSLIRGDRYVFRAEWP